MSELRAGQMKRYRYSNEYGTLTVELERDAKGGQVIENSLDADVILSSEKAQNLTFYHGVWGYVIEELFGEDEIANLCPPEDDRTQFWNGELTDYGFRAIFGSGLTFTLDEQGAFFDDSEV